jgi:hypothetical protein
MGTDHAPITPAANTAPSGAIPSERGLGRDVAALGRANLDGMPRCIGSPVILPSGARYADGVTALARRSRAVLSPNTVTVVSLQ